MAIGNSGNYSSVNLNQDKLKSTSSKAMHNLTDSLKLHQKHSQWKQKDIFQSIKFQIHFVFNSLL